jgi:zinc D-Ala-D-Ala carboxypeptidase
MPLDNRKLFLSCAVALTTLASVVAIVPLGLQPDADRRSVSAEERAPRQPPPPSLSNDAPDEARPAEASEARPAEVVSNGTETGAPSVAEGAAQQNRALKDNLSWTFGGKAQRGWSIYVPLIQRALGTEDDPASERFAASLARWQKNVGLKASGVLDEATLMRMVSTWQSQRMKSRVYPQPDQLLTVPRAEFYDSGRADDLRQVERQTYAAYKRMLAAAIADSSLQLKTQGVELAASEKYLKIISAFRSREYQDRLRKLEPNAGRAALAVNSPHFTGRALDIYVGGEPTITKDFNRALQTETPAYKWLVKNASRFGFCPYFYEPWHWEYCAP